MALNVANLGIIGIVELLGSGSGGGWDGAVAQPLMWTASIMETAICLDNVIEMV